MVRAPYAQVQGEMVRWKTVEGWKTVEVTSANSAIKEILNFKV
jgi:hypothetical protein